MAKKRKKLFKKSLAEVKTEEAQVEKIKKTKIRVVGIGGGGGNIVSELAQKLKKATFIAANTDLKALKEVSRKVERFQFGESLTHGLGTGMNAELGEMAALAEKEKIKKLLQGQDLVILIATLGGGVGSGAAPVFAKISRNLGNLTYGIFTPPFKFEGEKKMEMARDSLEKIRPTLNALTIIPNERIFQIIDKNTPLKNALSAINKNLSESLEGLIETIYQPGLINIDFADLKTILEGRGRLSYLNTLSVPRKEGAAKEVIEKTLNSPLYPYGIRGARGVLYNIAGGKGISLEEVNQISKAIAEKVNKKAKIIFGLQPSPTKESKIKITLLATGLSMKNPPPEFGERPKLRLRPAPKKIFKKARPVKIEEKTVSPQPSPQLKVKKLKKRKKIKAKKIKVVKKPVPEAKPQPEVPKENPPPTTKILVGGEKIRKSALQIKKEAEEAEKEMLEKEKFWETPAFLRKKFKVQ